MRDVKSILRSGNRLMLSPSNYETHRRYNDWKIVAKQSLAGTPCAARMRFTFASLSSDLEVLDSYVADKTKIRKKNGKNSSVFVVMGRDEKLRNDLFEFLRAIGLKPIEWSQAVSFARNPTPFIGEILERALKKCQAVLVVFSGDDEVRLKRQFLMRGDPAFERRLTGQPRPNVIFEAGMAFGQNPSQTVVIEVGKIRPISDWAGRHFLQMDGSASARKNLVDRLRKAKCKIDISGSGWLTAGRFKQ